MAPRRRADIVGPTRHPFEQQALTLRAARGAKIAGEARRVGMVRHDCQNRTQRCRVSDGKLVVRLTDTSISVNNDFDLDWVAVAVTYHP